jgi:uncharacterized membrane protein
MTFLRILSLAALAVLSVSLIWAPIHIPQAHAQSGSATRELNLTFTTIDVPGVSITEINGINTAGDMVGFSGDNLIGPLSGFLYSNGTFTSFDYPGQTVTVPGGINDSGLIVGYATQNADQRTSVVGFLYDGAAFTTLKDGGNSATYGFGINNAGVVVGEAGSLFASKGFQLVNGRYKTVNFPGSYNYGGANGINNQGLVVGWTSSGSSDFGYTFKNGKFRNIDFQGAQASVALGVNDSGIIVGWYNPTNTNDYHGFAFKNGKYLSFSYPGAVWTFAAGINKVGQIVGSYSFDRVAFHGFVTSAITDADFRRPVVEAR